MARGRKATTVKKKINMLLYGEPFTGKSTFASQAAYMHNEDGSPMRVLYVDCESGSVDNYLDEMENNGVDLGNIYILYTQSLGEILDCINKIKNNEDFYELDEEGNETDEIVVDAEGKPFRADIIIVDGVTVAHQAAQQGLLEFSKKRARVRADSKGLVGDEKLVAIEGSSLETRDWGNISYKGSNLCLSLLGTGIHSIITCREKDETMTVKDSEGKIASVPTGKKIPAGFKGLDYNMHTVIRFFRNEDDEVCAYVEKDRTDVHPKETLVDPQLLDWQVLIDNSVGKANFVLSNNLDAAVATEQEIYSAEVMNNATKSLSKADVEKMKSAVEDASSETLGIKELQDQIKGIINKLDPVAKKEMKAKLEAASLPTVIGKVTDVEILNKILEVVSA
jgi:KaiC/GvpD/RAD55 family RecA-like ATPase